MTVLYLLSKKDDSYANSLNRTLDSIELTASADDLKEKGGFTEYRKGYLYFCRDISGKDGYEVSFGITVKRETLEIEEFAVLDENFLQPHFTDAEYNGKISEILNGLQEKGIIKFTNYLET